MTGLPFDPKAWEWEMRAWVLRMGGLPTDLLASHDRGGGYQMHRVHVFKVRPGRYVLVRERGCSCYSSENACIFVYGDKHAALADFERLRVAADDEFPEPTGVKA